MKAYKEISLQLTDEHRILKESVHEFAVKVLRPAAIALDALPAADVVKKDSLFFDCMRKMFQQNYHTSYLPPEVGGPGLDPLGQHILFEELGYASVGLCVAGTIAQFPAFLATFSQNPALIKKWTLPFVECTDASIMGCWGGTEPDHGSDIIAHGFDCFHDPKINMRTRARKKGNKWIINGQKAAWVSCGPTATQVVMFVGIDESMGMAGGGICNIDLRSPGVSKGAPLDKMGQRDLPQGELFFDNVEIPEEDMLVDQYAYDMSVALTLSYANAGMGAAFTGLAQAALDYALDHCTHRTQGGKILCEHQAVQKKLFDMFKRVETARAMSRAAMIYNFTSSMPDLKYSIASKVYCTQTAFDIASDAIGLFGGIGLTKAYPVEKLMRDARTGMTEDGENDFLALVAGKMLAKEAME